MKLIAEEIKSANFSKEQLLEMAQKAFIEMEYPTAKGYYEELYNREPEDEKILSIYGHFLLENKEFELAKSILLKITSLFPNRNYKSYMELASLYNSEEAIEVYKQGVMVIFSDVSQLLKLEIQAGNVEGEILQKILEAKKLLESRGENLGDEEKKQAKKLRKLVKNLSQAYSAIGEIYQTDLLANASSENLCLECLGKASLIDEKNLDVLYQYANYYMNVENDTKAKENLTLLVEEIQKSGEDEEEMDDSTFEFKLQVVRLLVEVEMFQGALDVLAVAYEEDSENIEVLYLICFCNFKLGNFVAASEYAEDLNDRAEQLKQDPEIEEAVKEIVLELQSKDLTVAKDNQEDDEEWMDIE